MFFLAKIEEKTSFLTKNFFCFLQKSAPKTINEKKTRKNVFLKLIFKMAFREIGIKICFCIQVKKIVKLSNFDSFLYKNPFLNCWLSVLGKILKVNLLHLIFLYYLALRRVETE